MVRRIGTVIFLLVVTSVTYSIGDLNAQEARDHQVRRGDTLWDLSEHYLEDPLLWPKIWNLNPDVNNPHEISPGQIIKIPTLADRPETEAPAEDMGMAMEKPMPPAPAPVEKAAPPPKKMAIDFSSKKPLPINVATRTRVTERPETMEQKAPVDEAIARAYDRGIGIVTKEIPNRGRILHTEEGWSNVAVGSTILIDAPGAKVGEVYGVYRDRGEVKHPSRWSKSPGNLLSDVGIIEIVAIDSTKQIARVKRAFVEIKTGDLLGPVPQMPQVVQREKGRMLKLDGHIVALESFREIAGAEDIVYLDLGTEDGIEPGDTLFVRDRERGDARVAGEIMILRVTPKTAAALVTKQSDHELIPGDKVERLM